MPRHHGPIPIWVGGGAMVVIRGRYGVYNNSGVIMGREEGR